MARLIAAVGLLMFIFVSTGTSETKKEEPLYRCGFVCGCPRRRTNL